MANMAMASNRITVDRRDIHHSKATAANRVTEVTIKVDMISLKAILRRSINNMADTNRDPLNHFMEGSNINNTDKILHNTKANTKDSTGRQTKAILLAKKGILPLDRMAPAQVVNKIVECVSAQPYLLKMVY